jgi:hypothetical protein
METKQIVFTKNTKKQMIEDYKNKKEKRRVKTENWKFDEKYYLYDSQLNTIKNIYENQYKYIDKISKLSIQEINNKIYGYKQQDTIKKMLDNEKFITFESIINKMIECELKCYYCKKEMNVLYNISREMNQWTVDRINNDLGHNMDNYYLACLECNLKRRRRSDDKFLFTKQLNLVKVDRENKDTSLV